MLIINLYKFYDNVFKGTFMNDNNNRKIETLTGMRFVAIMLIVISHFDFFIPKTELMGTVFYNYLKNATFGVDYFFILSGFGLMLSDIHRNGSTKYNNITIINSIKYAIQHIKKIYPLYITTILLGIPIYIYLSLIAGKSMSLIISFLLLKLSACILLIQSAFGVLWLSHAFNGVCWFLSCLFCIYLVSPFFINLLKKYCISIRRIIISLLTLPILAVLTAVIFKQIEYNTCFDDIVYGSPYRRCIYVVFGMVIALLFNKIKNTKKIKYINTYEIFLLIFGIFWYIFRHTVLFALPYINLIYIIDMIFAGLTVLLLSLNKGHISNWFSNNKLVYLGNLSMYIFLIHYIICEYLHKIYKYYNINSTYSATIMISIELILTFMLSILLYTKSRKTKIE